MKAIAFFLMILIPISGFSQANIKRWKKKVKRTQVTSTRPELRFSYDLDKGYEIAEFMADQPEAIAKVDTTLSAQAKIILGYWITRKFSASLDWYLEHNKQPVAYYNFLVTEDLEDLKNYSIINEVNYHEYWYQSSDTISHYLLEAPAHFSKVGAAYVKVRYSDFEDTYMVHPDYELFDVWLVLYQ